MSADDDRYDEKETAERAEKVIRRMIATPPQPRATPGKNPRASAAKKSGRNPSNGGIGVKRAAWTG